MGSLNRFHNTVYGTSATNSFATTFENLNALRIRGTKTGFDGQRQYLCSCLIQRLVRQLRQIMLFQVNLL